MLFFGRIVNYLRNRSRQIFTYFDGERWRRVDPLVVGVRLEDECPDYQEMLDLIAKDITNAPIGEVRDDLMKQKRVAVTKLDAVARQIFGLKPLSETDGVTSGEAIGILTQFWIFMHELGVSANVFADSPVAG